MNFHIHPMASLAKKNNQVNIHQNSSSFLFPCCWQSGADNKGDVDHDSNRTHESKIGGEDNNKDCSV